MSTSHEVTISTSCEEAICRILQERTGIIIQDHQIRNLHNTVQEACLRFHYPNPDSYLRVLLSADDMSPEFEFLIAGVTVGESYFFRDDAQMDELAKDFCEPGKYGDTEIFFARDGLEIEL